MNLVDLRTETDESLCKIICEKEQNKRTKHKFIARKKSSQRYLNNWHCYTRHHVYFILFFFFVTFFVVVVGVILCIYLVFVLVFHLFFYFLFEQSRCVDASGIFLFSFVFLFINFVVIGVDFGCRR